MQRTKLTIFFLLFLAVTALPQTRFTIAEKPWDADKFGNIRAVVSVKDPSAKNIIVTSADGTVIANVIRGEIDNEFGDIYFEPAAGAGVYYIYYLPYKKAGSANYPKDLYPPFVETADAAWAASAKAVA